MSVALRFLPRDAMHKRGLYAVVRCPSVRVSVTFVYSVEINKHNFKTFSPSSSRAILVFPYQTLSQYSDWKSNAGAVGKNRDSRPISGFIECCRRCNRQVLYTQLRRTVGSWCHSSLVAISDVICCSRTTDDEVYDNKPQRYAEENGTEFNCTDWGI